MSFAKDDPDRFFFEALSIFWKALEDHLLDQSPPIMTYNRMFSLFGENTPENLKLLSDPLLRPMSHLMIDEFQDVSPQIVSGFAPACERSAAAARPCMWGAAHSARRCCAWGMTGSRSTAGAAVRPSTSWSSTRNSRRRAPPA
jgi:superfamily I DNA/RNA helicase